MELHGLIEQRTSGGMQLRCRKQKILNQTNCIGGTHVRYGCYSIGSHHTLAPKHDHSSGRALVCIEYGPFIISFKRLFALAEALQERNLVKIDVPR